MAKICIITAYKDPDYIRARTLRSAVVTAGHELIVVKNEHSGLLRYPEVFIEVILARLKHNPDAYILTFRGYEMLIPIRMLSIGKQLVYDEFINPIEWVTKEQRQVDARAGANRLERAVVCSASRFIVFVVSSSLFARSYKLLVSTVNLVLVDTESHADVSAELTGAPRNKYHSVPVGTDETNFYVKNKNDDAKSIFTVFYYGNMLPLHGLKYVIEAAELLKHEPIRFVLVGGNELAANDVRKATGKGAKIEYKSWVEFEQLPALMQASDLCLAGPFGNTFQSQYVITGKAYQYMAMGRPVVVGENKESSVFSDKHDALIVSQGDSAALADAIRWAANNRRKLAGIGNNGRALYEKKFSNEQVANQLSRGLQRLGLTADESSA